MLKYTYTHTSPIFFGTDAYKWNSCKPPIDTCLVGTVLRSRVRYQAGTDLGMLHVYILLIPSQWNSSLETCQC